MTIFRLTHLAGMALLAAVVATGTAKATTADPPPGRIDFDDIGSPTADGSTTGDLNMATTFMVSTMISGTSRSGIFIGFPVATPFPSFTFNSTINTSLAFGDPLFGNFTSTSISEVTNVPSVIGFDVKGDWMPGSFFPSLMGQTLDALFSVSFTQIPAHSGEISDSASFSTVVPEPPSIVLVLTGLAAGVGIYGLRRGRRYFVTA